jgi:hypothetical protein
MVDASLWMSLVYELVKAYGLWVHHSTLALNQPKFDFSQQAPPLTCAGLRITCPIRRFGFNRVMGNRVHSVVLDFAHPARVRYPRRQAKGYRLVHSLCREGSAKLIERFKTAIPKSRRFPWRFSKIRGFSKRDAGRPQRRPAFVAPCCCLRDR